MTLQLWEADQHGPKFRYDQADQETRQHLAQLPGASWIRSARLLAKLDDVRVDPTAEKRIIMVCDRAYDNVPRKIFGRSPMAHAVAYSTGETGLISTGEFVRLDLTGFTDLQKFNSVTKVEPAGPTIGSQPIRSEINQTSSTPGSRR